MLSPDDFLVCPVSKQPLVRIGRDYVAPCGFAYPDGDFRIDIDFTGDWSRTQDAYEDFLHEWRKENESIPGRMESVDDAFREVYEQITLEGLILDVGGDIGTVVTQANLDPEAYVSIDPLRVDFAAIEREFPRYFAHYRRSSRSCMVQGSAEFLPVRDTYFDTVHIRECLDHFAAPHVALKEAYRVLRPTGMLVVGLALEGAFQREIGEPERLRHHPMLMRLYRSGVATLKGYPRLFSMASHARDRLLGIQDHHIFHPTHQTLTALIEAAGFRIEKEVWQKAYHNVLFVQARKILPRAVGPSHTASSGAIRRRTTDD